MAEQHEEQWVLTQKKTFTKWSNNHLRKKGFPEIQDATTEWEDGIRLMQLINALYGTPMPKYNAAPKMRPHKLDNIALALKMVEDAKIKTNFLKSTHLIDHDLKMILGMMWAIILDYAIKGISEDDLTAKEGLLLWVRKKVAGYRDVDPPNVNNFTRDWRNGLALCALIHRHQPNLIDYDSLDKANAEHNIELAFSVAEQHLGIPRLLDVADLTCEKPDERSVMTYVAEFFHRFASQDLKEVAARRAAKFLAFTKNVNQLKFDYEEGARELLAWVQSVIDRFNNEQFGETIEQAVAVNDRLREFILHEKPQRTASKLDLETLYAQIQTQLRVNNRPAYVEDPSVSPDAIDHAFENLWSAEKAHARRARENRFRFVKKEESKVGDDKIAEIKASYAHFDADKDGKMTPVEFKAAMSAMSVPFKDDAALHRAFSSVSGGEPFITEAQYVEHLISLNEDKDTPEQIKQAFQTLANDAAFITESQLAVPPLTAEDVQYLAAQMPQHAAGNGLDYNAFVEQSFI